jgi:hypothetical protein
MTKQTCKYKTYLAIVLIPGNLTNTWNIQFINITLQEIKTALLIFRHIVLEETVHSTNYSVSLATQYFITMTTTGVEPQKLTLY